MDNDTKFNFPNNYWGNIYCRTVNMIRTAK